MKFNYINIPFEITKSYTKKFDNFKNIVQVTLFNNYSCKIIIKKKFANKSIITFKFQDDSTDSLNKIDNYLIKIYTQPTHLTKYN